jgi:hypothetical protein
MPDIYLISMTKKEVLTDNRSAFVESVRTDPLSAFIRKALAMTKITGLKVFTVGLLAAVVLFVPYGPTVAQERSATSTNLSAQEKKEGRNKAAPARRAAPQRAAPQRHAAPQRTTRRVAAPRATPQRTVPRTVTQRKVTSHAITQPKATSRVVKQQKGTPKVVAPAAAGRKTASPAAAPRVITPRGTRAVTTSRLRGVPARGAGRTIIRGHNYSVWRSGYRIRHGSGWRTFVALNTLGAIAIGSNEYYPYAYISAPEDYCQGLTEDGCELNWEQVQTEEGDVIDQCVAYCPWQ